MVKVKEGSGIEMGAHLFSTTLWGAAAERSGGGAFVNSVPPADSKAASRYACRRTPYVL